MAGDPVNLAQIQAAVRAQATSEMWNKAERIANAVVKRARALGISGAEDGADLVQRILEGTLNGRLHWNLELPLSEHVVHLIRHAGRRMRARGRRDMSLTPRDESDDMIERVEVLAAERAGLSDPVQQLELRRLSREAERRLSALVDEMEDPDVRAAFDALVGQQATNPKGVALACGFDHDRARRAWRRLRSLATKRLPERLRAEAIEALGGIDRDANPPRRRRRTRQSIVTLPDRSAVENANLL